MDDLPAVTHHSISSHPFDERIVEAIAAALGAPIEPAPFRHPSGAVFRLTIENQTGLAPTIVNLWPALGRVDALSPSSAVVFTEVRTVDLVGTVEVQFRRPNREMLIVARGGRVIVRA